jgi:hypothetical protein
MADANDWDDEFLILQSGDDPIADHGAAQEDLAEPAMTISRIQP